MPTARQCKDFLESVVNGDDKDLAAATRNRFAKLYRDWFPPDPDVNVNLNREEYLSVIQMMVQTWTVRFHWCRDSIQQDNPQTYFEWRVAVLRDMLRFIWVADRETAQHRVRMLVAGTVDFRPQADRIEPWRGRQPAARDWLEKWR